MNAKKTLSAALALALTLTVAHGVRAGEEPKTGDVEKQMAEAKKQMAEAKKQMAEAARQMAELSKQLAKSETSRKYKNISIYMEDRPRLGVLVNTDANPETDSKGALLEGVTPGGPAAAAGLKADDIITKFNGEKLAGPYADADEDDSAPGIKLTDLARKVKAGDKVTLEYLRGGKTGTVTFSPRVLDEKNAYSFHMSDIPYVGDIDVDIPDLPEMPEGVFALSMPNHWMNTELVELNPELGEYFGTSEGLLVVSAPKDSTLQLRGGDVLLKIGDRKAIEPSQAFRILRSYDPGETVSLEIVRKQKHQTLTVKIPERPTEKTIRHRHVEAPEPPAAPAPPEAPSPRASSGGPDDSNA